VRTLDEYFFLLWERVAELLGHLRSPFTTHSRGQVPRVCSQSRPGYPWRLTRSTIAQAALALHQCGVLSSHILAASRNSSLRRHSGEARATHRRVSILTAVLAGCALVSFGAALWDVWKGGFYFELIGFRISSWEIYKPVRNGLLFSVGALWTHDRDAASATWIALPRISRAIALTTAAASFAVATAYGVFAAGGSDAYGYLSQAKLWAAGHLRVAEPLTSAVPDLAGSVAPVGYRISPDSPASIVPTYSAGYPLVMAAAFLIGGESAMYLVVPLFGAIAVWLTYQLGTRMFGCRTGIVAAAMLMLSPIFMFQTFEPMSDIPATMWWLAAWVLATAPGDARAFGAGLAVSAAIATRPNLAPLALFIVAAVGQRSASARPALLCAVGVVPGCLLVAAVNGHLYGGMLSSGYGPVGSLFAVDRIAANLRRYPVWLVELHTPAILLAFAAPFVARRETDATYDPTARTLLMWSMLAFAVAVLGCYLCWIPFDSWPFLRFMLPAIPLLLVLSAGVLVSVLQRFPLAWRSALGFVVCVLLGVWCVVKAEHLGAFGIGLSEQRYVAVGEQIATSLPSNAVVITVIESGSVRMYGHRPTFRWDALPREGLDNAVDRLRAAAYAPYVLLEDWEESEFRAKFGSNTEADMNRPPAIVYRCPINVRVWRVE